MTNSFDVIIIGAGPAGLMAAYWAVKNGTKVLILEKNSQPGKKLLITGKGRCNITQYELDIHKLLEPFGKHGKFLYNGCSQFGVEATIDFFEEHGLKTKVERGKRIFPVSNQAQDVLNLFLREFKKMDVIIKYNSPISLIKFKNNSIEAIYCDTKKYTAKKYIICTGGLSYPSTGCTGDGYSWAKQSGHKLIEPKPALTPFMLKENWAKNLPGLTLKNVSISAYQNNKKHIELFGEALFTHFGISGPIILDMSKTVGELLPFGQVEIRIDFKPALSFEQVDKRLQREIAAAPKIVIRNMMRTLVPQKLISPICRLTNIEENKKIAELAKNERRRIVHALKEMPLTVTSLVGFEKALITSGGVSLKDIDPKTMRSKHIENMFFAGEIIDLDGSTGGYNLQVCWSTGYLAGKNCLVYSSPDIVNTTFSY